MASSPLISNVEVNSAVVRLAQAFCNGSIDPIVATDERGFIIAVNNAMLDLLGYERWEVVRKNISMLMPQRIATVHDQYMHRYEETNIAAIIDHLRTVPALHKDGSIVQIALKVSEHYEDGKRIFVGVMRNSRLIGEMSRARCLLEHMMPGDITAHIMSEQYRSWKGTCDSIAQCLPAATTCNLTVGFIDLIGFTKATSRMHPQAVSRMLTEIFVEFDAAIGSFEIECIKTIGDCYMFASRRTSRMTAHALNSVLFALRCVEIMRRRSQRGVKPEFSIRVGLATGPVSAGVIVGGHLAFDLWGATVNLAARLESHAPPNGVLVCNTTHAQASYHDGLYFDGPLKITTAKGFDEVTAYVVGESSTVLRTSTAATQALNSSRRKSLNGADGAAGWFGNESATNKYTCLVVDDEIDNMETLVFTESLNSQGVETVTTTHSACSDSNSLVHTPDRWDAIVVYMRPPVSDGIDTMLNVRDQSSTVPICAIVPLYESASSSPLAQQCLQVQADKLFERPVDTNAFQWWLKAAVHPVKQVIECSGEEPYKAIVVADDDPIVRCLVKEMLSEVGFVVHDTDDGTGALDLVDRYAPDLAIIDVHMPTMSGIEAAKNLRAIRSNIPIVGITTAENIEDVVTCFHSGMNDVICKPVNKKRLITCVAKWIKYGPNSAPYCCETPAMVQSIKGVTTRLSQTVKKEEKEGGEEEEEEEEEVEEEEEKEEEIRSDDIDRVRKIAQELRENQLIDFQPIFHVYLSDVRKAISITETFVTEVIKHTKCLRQCLHDADYQKMFQTVQVLKGASAQIGASRVFALCSEMKETIGVNIESKATENDPHNEFKTSIRGKIDRVEEIINQIAGLLQGAGQ